MKRTMRYGAALIALLFVGAGCVAPMQKAGNIEAVPEKKMEAGPAANVDSTVDDALRFADDEAAAQADVEKDADSVTTDSAELDTLTQGDYEIK